MTELKKKQHTLGKLVVVEGFAIVAVVFFLVLLVDVSCKRYHLQSFILETLFFILLINNKCELATQVSKIKQKKKHCRGFTKTIKIYLLQRKRNVTYNIIWQAHVFLITQSYAR